MKIYCPQDHLEFAMEALDSFPTEIELLWRAARACLAYRCYLIESAGFPRYLKFNDIKLVNQLKKRMIHYSDKCLFQDDNHVEGLTFKAIAVWIEVHESVSKRRPEVETDRLLDKLKQLLDKGLGQRPTDPLLLFYRVLWTSSGFIFKDRGLKSAKIDGALKDLLNSHFSDGSTLRPLDAASLVTYSGFQPTLILMSKLYLMKKDKESALKFLKEGLEADKVHTPDGFRFRSDLVKKLSDQLIPDV